MTLLSLLLLIPACLAIQTDSTFTCPSFGYFANPDDCSTYYACSLDLVPVSMKCPSGLYFNPTTRICDRPENVNCEVIESTSNTPSSTSTTTESTTPDIPATTSTTTEIIETTIPDSGPSCPSTGNHILENPKDCTTYFVCIEGDYALIDCPTGYGFNANTLSCVLAEEVDCSAGVISTTTSSPPVSSGPNCPTSGTQLLENPEDCTTYYVCIEGEYSMLECPEGYEFKPDTLRCENYNLTGCGATGTPSSTTSTTQGTNDPLCPSSGVHIVANPSDCGSYYVCIEGFADLIECPAGFEFKPENERCENFDLTGCRTTGASSSTTSSAPDTTSSTVSSSETGTATGSTSSTTPGDLPDCTNEPDGTLLPHPTDCTMFCECGGGYTYVNICPPGLEFNAEALYCDHPDTANCQVSKFRR